jgi:prepilin-type processing-associated H-X9-DG protein
MMAALCAAAFFPAASRAEPLPAELNLIPRDAGLFVSVRVSDLWNDTRLKPLRDFLVEEGRLLRDFEKDTGFRPDDVERVSLVCANFHPRYVVPEPLIVVTFKRPYDLNKLLDAFDGMTEADYRRNYEQQRFPKGFDAPRAKFAPPPRFNEKVPDAPPKLAAPEKEKPEFSDCHQKVDPADQPAKEKNALRDLKAPYYMLARTGGFMIPINERTIVIGMNNKFEGQSAMHELLAALLKRSDKGPLTPALEAAAGKHVLVLGVNILAIKEAIPEKGWVNALPIDSFLKCRSVTATLDFSEDVRLSLHVDGPDEATAKRVLDVIRSVHILGMESLPGLTKMIDDDSPARVMLSLVEPILREAKFELKGTTASVVMASKVDDQLAKSITDTIEKLKEAATRARAQNNLKQMALAVHNFESANGRFPFQGVPGLNGINPKLSWRVTILPYIEEAGLYQQFKLDEAWDSDHNKKLIAKMPKLYAPLGGASAPVGHTFYRTFTGPQTFSAAQGFAGITDGTSNTILFVEAGESVPWTKPEDFPYDPNKPLPKLGGHFKGKMNVAMGDGSVRTIDLKKVPKTVLRALITANGGEVISGDY